LSLLFALIWLSDIVMPVELIHRLQVLVETDQVAGIGLCTLSLLTNIFRHDILNIWNVIINQVLEMLVICSSFMEVLCAFQDYKRLRKITPWSTSIILLTQQHINHVIHFQIQPTSHAPKADHRTYKTLPLTLLADKLMHGFSIRRHR
jgi:hypothetical protein